MTKSWPSNALLSGHLAFRILVVVDEHHRNNFYGLKRDVCRLRHDTSKQNGQYVISANGGERFVKLNVSACAYAQCLYVHHADRP